MSDKKCTVGKTHKWEWVKDVTLKTSPRPGYLKISAKGIFKCACGAAKYGSSKNGLL